MTKKYPLLSIATAVAVVAVVLTTIPLPTNCHKPAKNATLLMTNTSRHRASASARNNSKTGTVLGPAQSSSQTTTLSANFKNDETRRRGMMDYQNTPPLFVTSTRDFYIDLSRHKIGYLLTTMQAHDQDGDQLEYSIHPGGYSDASPYFSINATTGELRLAHKSFPDPNSFSGRDEDDVDTDNVARANSSLKLDSKDDDLERIPHLYFLKVVAFDGKYPVVIELQIHVVNFSSFGTNLPAITKPERDRLGSVESLMKSRSEEFYRQLYSSRQMISDPVTKLKSNVWTNNSTMALQDFVNPGLMFPQATTDDTSDSSSGNAATNLLPSINEQKKLALNPDDSVSAERFNLNSTIVDGSHADQQPNSLPESLIERRHHQQAANIKQTANELVVQQSMMMSFIIILCSCSVIAFVLIAFIVPKSFKRLKKRLKNMEMQHEQLSQKASNGGGSSIISGSCLSHGSLMTTNGTGVVDLGGHIPDCHHMPSSLSQFTLNSSDRSCNLMPMPDSHISHHDYRLGQMHSPLNRQSSLDSSFSAHNEHLSFNQLLTNGQIQSNQQQLHQPTIMMINSHALRNAYNSNQITSSTNNHNNLNIVNSRAKVNPFYLDRQHHQNDDSTGAVSSTNNIYCPIEDEFYSTINSEINVIDDEGKCSTQLGKPHHQDQIFNNHDQGLTPMMTTKLDDSQVGSLVGQTSDFNNYIASDCAQPITEFRKRWTNEECNLMRDSNSPNHSISSHSSTRSLARFLSLPARHWSHLQHDVSLTSTQHDSVQGKKQNFFNELDYFLDKGKNIETISKEQQPAMSAKTIARADRINQEQQVPHKREIDITRHQWDIERHKVNFLDILDEGQFGLVWRCKMLTSDRSELSSRRGASSVVFKEKTVAVKMLKSFAAKDARERDELLAEIEIMKLVCDHPNIVRILHCCTKDISPTRPILLIMEYVELGKLQSILEKSRVSHQYATTNVVSNQNKDYKAKKSRAGDPSVYHPENSFASLSIFNCEEDEESTYEFEENDLDRKHFDTPLQSTNNPQRLLATSSYHLTSRDLIKFIYHVAKGMEHISSKCIVHRDLASRNILISADRVCKIGDFGMARHMENIGDVYERHSRNTKVPVRWMAPEVLLSNSFTTKSDVFSFGILMWEIVTLGSTPYCHLKTDQILDAVARKGERPERPEYCHEVLYRIMSSCWSQDPTTRPSFHELVVQLDSILMSTEEYIELDEYPDHNYYNMAKAEAPFELL